MRKRDYLYSLYTNHELPEKQRKLAAALYEYYIHSDNKHLTLMDVYPYREIKIDGTHIKRPSRGDYRIKKLRMANFRKYPELASDSSYGIDFTKENKPVSLYLVGRNGTGKSSIYAALEYAYIGRVSAKLERGLTNEAYEQYGFGQVDGTDGVVKVDTPDLCWEVYVSKPMVNLTIPETMFCSGSDVRVLLIEKDITNYFLRQIGEGEILDLENELNTFYSYLCDSSSYLVGKRYEPVEENLTLQLLIQYYTNVKIKTSYNKLWSVLKALVNDWDLLKNEKDSALIPIDREQYQKDVNELEKIVNDRAQGVVLREIYSQFRYHLKDSGLTAVFPEELKEAPSLVEYAKSVSKALETIDLLITKEISFEDIRKYIEQSYENKKLAEIMAFEQKNQYDDFVSDVYAIIKGIEEYKKDMVQTASELLAFCNEILNDVSPTEDRIELKVQDGKIFAEIMTTTNTGDKFSSKPYQYYNTFRFRLYTVALKLASAIAYMKKEDCYFPIVLDDMFTASDYDNSNNLQNFVCKLYKTAEKYIPGKLQLIILTHDGVIQQAFENGSSFIEDGGRLRQIPYISARLFDYPCSKDIKETFNDEWNGDYEPIIFSYK